MAFPCSNVAHAASAKEGAVWWTKRRQRHRQGHEPCPAAQDFVPEVGKSSQHNIQLTYVPNTHRETRQFSSLHYSHWFFFQRLSNDLKPPSSCFYLVTGNFAFVLPGVYISTSVYTAMVDKVLTTGKIPFFMYRCCGANPEDIAITASYISLEIEEELFPSDLKKYPML